MPGSEFRNRVYHASDAGTHASTVPLKSKLPPLVLFLARRESCLERRDARLSERRDARLSRLRR